MDQNIPDSIDFHINNNSKKKDYDCLVSVSEKLDSEEFKPIQKDCKLFKYILYTTKIEIKFNNFINLIYNTSLCEIGFWILGFLLFLASPKDLYLIWVLIVHLGKGILGLILLGIIPKTYELLENVIEDPNFKEDMIIEQIQNEIKESFFNKWESNKSTFLVYAIFLVICFILDIIIFLVQLFKFGNDEWILMQTCILVFILIFIISDVIYVLWFITLNFSLSQEMINPVKNAIFGSVKDLKNYALNKLKRNNQE